MSVDNQGIPVRKNSSGVAEVETRPIYVEEWLDSLPYIDFDKTTHLLNKAMRETNHVSMKPAQRLELIQQYNRPYQYYIESQIKVGARHTLRSIETLQSQVHALKQLSVAMAMACRITVEETLNKKTMWMQSKPPLDAILMAMNYFSHTLIFSYLEYAPVPKNIWREINFLYDFAESINQDKTQVHDASNDKSQKRSSISAAYKRIVLASMVDPHHLPFGAIWEVYAQLDSWVEKTEVKSYEAISNGTGFFVMDIKNDVRPVPYSKFNQKLANDRELRLLDARALVEDVQTYLHLLELNRPPGDEIIFSSHYAKTVLEQMAGGWGLPQKRKHAREARSGKIEMAIGVHSCHYFLSGEKHFFANVSVDENDEFAEDELNHTANYYMEMWDLVDHGPGGYAITRDSNSDNHARVGDMVAIKKGKTGIYKLGVIRWLMIRPKKVYKAGIEILTEKAVAVSIRKSGDDEYKRAFLDGAPASANAFLLVGQGFYEANKEIEVLHNDKVHKLTAGALMESTIMLEQFGVSPG